MAAAYSEIAGAPLAEKIASDVAHVTRGKKKIVMKPVGKSCVKRVKLIQNGPSIHLMLLLEPSNFNPSLRISINLMLIITEDKILGTVIFWKNF